MKTARAIALAVGAALAAPFPVAGQGSACSSGVISEISFERAKPFGPEATSSDALFGWAFRLANAVHVTTRESVVRRELFFRPGDCFAPDLVTESERSLRRLRFISESGIGSVRLPDGSHRVAVRTMDSWARSGFVSISIDDGLSITGVSARDNNFLGTGTVVGYLRRTFRERKRTGVLVRQTNLFGSRVDATFHGGNTRSGRYYNESLYRPFAGEVGRTAFRQVASSRDDHFAYAVDPTLPSGPALIRLEAERYELSLQRRFGAPDGVRIVVGTGVSREIVRFGIGLDEGAMIVEGGAFSAPVPGPPEILEAVAGQSRDHAADRVSVTLGLRSMRVVERSGLDAVRAQQDVGLGTTLLVTMAPSLRLGRSRGRDVLTRVLGEAGFELGSLYLAAKGDFQARDVAVAAVGEPTGLRDILWDLQLHGYLGVSDAASLFGRVWYSAGYSMDRPFQLTLGGRESVRAFSEDAFPGARRFVATVEPRIAVPGLGLGFTDVGISGFMDIGRMWGGGVPYGAATGWEAGVGAGLRFGLPKGGQNVFRVDVGRAVTGPGAHGVVFRAYTELFGLLDRRSWPTQIARSRWYGSDPDLTRRPVRPLAGN